MGNCCGRESNFKGQGRTLASSAADEPPAQPIGRPSGQPGRASTGKTLGGSSAPSTGAGSAAAQAAEARASQAKATAQKGKLSQKLQQQKQQTDAAVLKQNAEEQRLHREVDQNTQNLANN